MRRGAGLLAATVMVLLAGCSGGAGAGPTPAPSAPSASAASPSVVAPSTPPGSTPAGTPGSTESSLVPGASCLTGTWRLVRFIGLGAQSTYGIGQGGDVTVAFDNGRYTVAGEGKEPITVVLAGQSARLTVDGTVSGTYQPDGAEMSFTIAEATGEGTLQSGNQKQTLPMESVGQVIAPRGKATLACPDNQLLIALPTVRLELER